MGKRILLVEGRGDQHVMWNLFEVRAIPDQFAVACPRSEEDTDEGGGVERLLDSIPWQVAAADLERLAVVVDANDKGPDSRWQSIRDRLFNRGYEGLPAEHSPDGTVVELSLRPDTPRTIRFAVWIMPDNRSTGMLEDFVAGLIHEDDAMLPFVDGFLESIPPDERRFQDAHRPKARIHCWLAVSARPGRPMGQAIKADRYLDANHPSVEPFLNWISRALVD